MRLTGLTKLTAVAEEKDDKLGFTAKINELQYRRYSGACSLFKFLLNDWEVS